jgi:DNA primase
VEGPLDWLALRAWGVPALGLCGSLVRPTVMEGLRRFARIYLALDADEGGDKGTQVLLAASASAARPRAGIDGVQVRLRSGVGAK